MGFTRLIGAQPEVSFLRLPTVIVSRPCVVEAPCECPVGASVTATDHSDRTYDDVTAKVLERFAVVHFATGGKP
jgi:hypothetical protein